MTSMMDRTQLMAHLEALGIKTQTVDHPAAFTVADSDQMAIELPGAHTKNLFVKDSDGSLLLVIAHSLSKVDLKRVAKRMNVGRLSFARPEIMMSVLGVTPGTVTAFAIVNDRDNKVQVVIDEKLIRYETINCHPLDNCATTNIAREDLLRFIRDSGHEPRILALSASD